MKERIWDKFHPLFGPDLKVGFETTFPKAVVLDLLDSLYGRSGLIHDPPNEPTKRVYEPAIEVRGSCVDGDAAQVFFGPVSSDGSLFRRLIFARKINHSTQKPRCWMVAARHGEVEHFGFDSWNSRNERYLSLAYTGLNEQFIPVYVKIQTEGGDGSFVYLEVWAWDDDVEVVIQARRVVESEVPELLRLAQPGGLIYSV